jgi:hypothetical protein
MAVISGGNVIPGALRRVGDPTLEGGYAGNLKVARGTYDFAVDGGAVGAINLIGSADIPSGAVVLGGLIDVITALTSGGAATGALKVEGAGDLVAATVVSGAPWSTTGRKSIIPVFTGATTVKTTAARDITLTVAVAALTAGKFDVYLVYLDID